ncbi:hypothetical protein B2M20_18255 [Nitrobacter vulgaris]|uniref:Uncharacterized protein n=1 Tax=Nitrobacter vulgaris TaxID=29421 RepID=A0A1V4HTM0_NITVU|nr:hypothetical protein B2M20_18255 [Nitrobacter vulgaris]
MLPGKIFLAIPGPDAIRGGETQPRGTATQFQLSAALGSRDQPFAVRCRHAASSRMRGKTRM